MVILHDFIRKSYHKKHSNRNPVPLCIVNHQILSLNYYILCFRKMYKMISFPKKDPENLLKTGNILQMLE